MKIKTFLGFRTDPFYLIGIFYEDFGGVKAFDIALLGLIFTVEFWEVHK